MSNISEQQRIEYLKQQEFYTQIILENKMKELSLSLDTYQITDNTELSTLEKAIMPLKHQLDTLINQLLVHKEQALCALHYSEIEFEEIEINNINALFTTARVDRDYLPKGYYAYDIRSNGDEKFATIESVVNMDHSGTILTKQFIDMTNDGCPIVDYNFLGGKVIGYNLTHVKTDIQELLDTYNARLDVYFDKIERTCKFSNNSNIPTNAKSPNFMVEIIMPIYQSMAKFLIKKGIDVKIPDPNTYYLIGNYFRIRAGGKIVGGFSISNGHPIAIYFTHFNHTTPIGEKVKITDIEQLCQLILDSIKYSMQKHQSSCV